MLPVVIWLLRSTSCCNGLFVLNIVIDGYVKNRFVCALDL